MEKLTLEVISSIFFRAPLPQMGMESSFPVALASSKLNFLSARKTDAISWTLRKIVKQNLDPYQVKLLLTGGEDNHRGKSSLVCELGGPIEGIF